MVGVVNSGWALAKEEFQRGLGRVESKLLSDNEAWVVGLGKKCTGGEFTQPGN